MAAIARSVVANGGEITATDFDVKFIRHQTLQDISRYFRLIDVDVLFQPKYAAHTLRLQRNMHDHGGSRQFKANRTIAIVTITNACTLISCDIFNGSQGLPKLPRP